MSSAASSADFEFLGIWLMIWSSISSPIKLLMAPRAAARRRRTSAHGSSSFSPLRTDSSWPMTFLVRVVRSSFSLDVWDISLDYPIRVGYHGLCLPHWGRVGDTATVYMGTRSQESEPPGRPNLLERRAERA